MNHVHHVYMPATPFETQALKDVSLTIDDGEIVGLIGHTGSGKSTLVQHFNALLKPTSGEIFINNQNLADKATDKRRLRQQVGLIFQYPEHQLFEETVYKDIAFGPINLGLNKREIDERVFEAMRLVGLDESFMDRSPFTLSGGEKRRTAIAGVLAMRPEILILDEPTAGLDPKGKEGLLYLISQIHAERKNTVILVTHNMDDIAKLADRVIVMNQAKIVMSGTPAEIFARGEELSQMGLGVPEAAQLTKKLCDCGLSVPRNIYDLETLADCIANVLKNRE